MQRDLSVNITRKIRINKREIGGLFMRTFRFEISAHTEIDILAEDLNVARRQADVEWHKMFQNGLFGEVEFLKEIKEETD